MTDHDKEPGSRRMGLESIGGLLVAAGIGLALLGGALLLASRIPGLNLFNLPGDIRVQSGNVSCVFPIVTMIVLSLVLTILLNIIIRLINRP
jgi:hypothetical protein